MLYDHAVLGETPELCLEAAKWFAEEKERLEKRQKASEGIVDHTCPKVEKC